MKQMISQGNLKSYITGFIFCIILTVIPFVLVMSKIGSVLLILAVIVIFAVAQILVQLIYFLHVNRTADEGWDFIALLFSALIIGIIVIGSLWIMYNLNVNMMPS